jgi:hypothetical protein
MLLALLFACAEPKGAEEDSPSADTGASADTAEDSSADTGAESGAETGSDSGDTADSGEDTSPPPVDYTPWPFVAEVVSFTPGAGAGYGQDRFPDVVYGPPQAPGDGGGSLDVLSVGESGEIVVAFLDVDLIDGPGDDLAVFENAFRGWPEPGIVGVSEDGEAWYEWPCDPVDAPGGYPGCAGVALVYANASNGVDARLPEAGGDRYDLAELGLTRARYVRVRDSGTNPYAGTSGGFDLDAMAALHVVER